MWAREYVIASEGETESRGMSVMHVCSGAPFVFPAFLASLSTALGVCVRVRCNRSGTISRGMHR